MFHRSIVRASSLFVVLILGTTAAKADDGLIRHLNNHLEGSLGAEHLSYRELNDDTTQASVGGTDLDTENGTLVAGGFSAAWQGRLGAVDRVRAGFDVHVAAGDAHYNGYEQDLQTGALTPLTATTEETFADLQLKAGKGFELWTNRDLLTPYFSLGFTAWNRDLSSAPGGYTEDYEHFFWKFGLEYQIEVATRWVADIDASYGRTFSASMTSSDVPPTFDLGSTPIQRYSLGLRYLATRKFYVGADVYWMHYGYGESPEYTVTFENGDGAVFEPTSRTTRDGLLFVAGWAYR